VTDTEKEVAFTMTVTWPWVLYGLESKISPFHCALFAGKNVTMTALAPAKLNQHFTTNHGHLSDKQLFTFNDFGFTRQTR
jgi:hypothetical protein